MRYRGNAHEVWAMGVAAVTALCLCIALVGCGSSSSDDNYITDKLAKASDAADVRDALDQIGTSAVGLEFGSEYVACKGKDLEKCFDATDECDAIAYKAAPLSINGGNAAPAQAFLDWIRSSAAARKVLLGAGFTVNAKDKATSAHTSSAKTTISVLNVSVSTNNATTGHTVLGLEKAYREEHPDVTFKDYENYNDFEAKAVGNVNYNNAEAASKWDGLKKGCGVLLFADDDAVKSVTEQYKYAKASDVVDMCGDTLVAVSTPEYAAEFPDMASLANAKSVVMISDIMHSTGSGKYARQALVKASLLPASGESSSSSG